MIFINRVTFEIIAIAHAGGSVHDFEMYKENVGTAVLDRIRLLADSGFQGIVKYHKNSLVPKKKSKYNPLSMVDKIENKRVSKERIFVENITAKLKVFKILSNRYRNRRKRHDLRTALICGIYNYELHNT